jgi:hypothetical protein
VGHPGLRRAPSGQLRRSRHLLPARAQHRPRTRRPPDRSGRPHPPSRHGHAAGELARSREAWQQALAIYEDIQHPETDQVHAKLASTGIGCRPDRLLVGGGLGKPGRLYDIYGQVSLPGFPSNRGDWAAPSRLIRGCPAPVYKKHAPEPRVRYLHRCHRKVHSLHPKPAGLQAIRSTTRSTPPPQRGRPWKLAHG